MKAVEKKSFALDAKKVLGHHRHAEFNTAKQQRLLPKIFLDDWKIHHK